MSSALLLLDGEPQGGTLEVYVQPSFGDPRSVSVRAEPRDTPRTVAERVVDSLAAAGLARPGEIDRVQATILLRGVDDVDLRSFDAGLLSATWLSARDLVADNSTRGGGTGLPAATAAAPYDPDARVLEHLGRYLTALADQGEIEVRTTESLGKVQALYLDLMRALQEGDGRIDLPNPGSRRQLAVGVRDARAIAGNLGRDLPAMARAQADLSDARAKQVDAIEAKEREAKTGGGGQTGGGQAGGGQGTQPRGGGGTAPGSSAPPVGEAAPPGGGPAGGSADDTGGPETLVRPAGSSEDYARRIAIEELTFVKGRGLEMVIGRIGDRWYLAKGRRENEYPGENGTTVVRSEWHFGDFRPDAPEEDQPVEIDYDALMEFLEADEPGAEEGVSTTERLISIALDFVPIVGDVKGIIEIAIGRDLITNEALSTEERALGAALMLLPFAGRLIRGTGKTALRTTGRAVRAGREIGEEGLRHVDEVAETFSVARRADGGDVVVRRLDDAGSDARHLPGSVARTGKCFVEGTLVAVDATTMVPIENLRAGDVVLAAVDAEERPSTAATAAARVVGVRRRAAPSAVRLSVALDMASGRRLESLTCTPRHPIATPRGWIAAADLDRGELLLLRDGTGWLTGIKPVPGPVQVVNLELDDRHCFFAGRLHLLVHNWCEKAAQVHLDSELDRIMNPFRDPTTGDIVREPAFRHGQYQGYGHRSNYRERAARLGIPLPDGKVTPEVRRAVNEASEGVTKPDYVGDLTAQWGDLPQGTRVNAELKTVRDGRTIRSQMSRLTDGGNRNKGSLLTQAGMRVTQTPGEHVFVLDVSHAEGFARGGNIQTQADDALAEMRSVINDTSLPYRDLHQAYPRVAFMVRDPSGALRVTEPFPMPRFGD